MVCTISLPVSKVKATLHGAEEDWHDTCHGRSQLAISEVIPQPQTMCVGISSLINVPLLA